MKMFLYPLLIVTSLSFNKITSDKNIKNCNNTIFQDTTYKIWLEKKQVKPMHVIYTIDTTNNKADIERICSQKRGDLFVFAAKQKLNTGVIMMQYHYTNSSYIFETSVEVDRLPSLLYWDIKRKIIYSKIAVVAHFKGNTIHLKMAYAAIEKWLVQNNAVANGMPYEINLNDPNFITNVNSLLVDVYQPIKLNTTF
jgi:effector-binding domain-containing protein